MCCLRLTQSNQVLYLTTASERGFRRVKLDRFISTLTILRVAARENLGRTGPMPTGPVGFTITAMTETSTFPADRTSVVTGAGSRRGIGRATADRLARDGWSVAVLDIDGVGAAGTAAEVAGKWGVAVKGITADIADERSVDT